MGLAISQNMLAKALALQFPQVRKPLDYANLILESKRIGATNRLNAKKRKQFLESDTITASIFQSSYSRLGLLGRLKNADKTIAVSSTRHRPGFAFSHSMILSYLNYERHLLYKHILRDVRIKKIVCSILKVSIQTSMQKLQKGIESGTPYQQTSVYNRIYETIKKKNLVVGYMWLGVVALPADLYYLSDLSNSLLRKRVTRR